MTNVNAAHRATGRVITAAVAAGALLVGNGVPRGATGQPAAEGAAPSALALFEPGRVSTGAHELAIRFSPKMDEMYVMRSGLDWQAAIVVFRRAASGWSRPDLLRLPQRGTDIAYPFIAALDGRLFFDARSPASSSSGGPVTSDIWVASREGAAWGTPSPLGQAVNSAAVEMHASVAANGNLYFSSNRPGGLGGFDIYRAIAVAGGYRPAENLGPAVNSAENEYHALIARDESYLLFDARRASGMGGHDLYISVRGADGRWEPAAPLTALNTPAGEMRPYVSPDNRWLFFCSDRSAGRPDAVPPSFEAFDRRISGPGNGSQDIYRIALDVVSSRLPARDASRRASRPGDVAATSSPVPGR